MHAHLVLQLLEAFHPSLRQLDSLEVLQDLTLPPCAFEDSYQADLASVALDCEVLLPLGDPEGHLDVVEFAQDMVSETVPNLSSSCYEAIIHQVDIDNFQCYT